MMAETLSDTDPMPETIYALRGDDGISRYIGKTSKTLEHRLKKHIRDARYGCRGHRNNWIRSLLRRGVVPSILPIETGVDGSEIERKWISELRRMNWPLVNSTDGGEGVSGLQFSPEHRRKISYALTGKTRSEATRALIRLARAKQPPAHTTPHTEETKAKIRKSLSDPLIREMIGAANRGAKRTNESIIRMSLAQRKAATLEKILKTAIPIRCVETKVQFRSFKLAADSVGGLRSLISRAAKTGIRHKGLHWEKI